ncbi:MAG: VOC family protein [Alphaproteobacteria bacterium]|nr:VOC family protein [Alphaproteobacteria bacterium]
MDQRISIITLSVSDLAASRAFYGRLGFTEASISQDGIAFYAMGTFVFALYPTDKRAEDIGEDLPEATAGGVTLAYNVRAKEDVASVLSEAVAAGARLVKPAEDVFWGGHSGYFADPDGHFWEVAWNPHSPLEADGSLRVS